jgi:hypothetical protein
VTVKKAQASTRTAVSEARTGEFFSINLGRLQFTFSPSLYSEVIYKTATILKEPATRIVS